MSRRGLPVKLAAVALVTLALTGCKHALVPDYNQETTGPALRKITNPAELPDLANAFAGKDEGLLTALDRSIGWFAKPTSARFYPLYDISHDQAQTSLKALRLLLTTARTPQEFRDRVYQDFDAYISVGCDNKGTVLYTGYFSPIFSASVTQTPEFRYPLYKRPATLVADPVTGETKGYTVNGTLQTFPARSQIESSNMLAGTELVWLRDALDAYIIQVNGSAKLTMTDGKTLYVGYAGNNGHEYTSIGKLLVQDGKIDKNRLSLPTLRAYFRDHPGELSNYTRHNERFVFFQKYDESLWPAGSLGLKVSPFRSLATDKGIFPRGCLTLTQTHVPSAGGAQMRLFDQFMLDQDAGGAIRAAGRGDIYMGVGTDAEQLAGRQFAEGRLYYFFLKPEKVATWQTTLRGRGPM